MKLKKLTLACAISFAVATGQSFAGSEVEPNDTVSSSNYLGAVTDLIVVDGALATNSSVSSTYDLDFYSFYAQTGAVVTLDIDGGVEADPAQSVDTILYVFGPGPDYKLWRENDVSASPDEGSSSQADARIDDFVVPATGVYTVAVSTFPQLLIDGGNLLVNTFGGFTMDGSTTQNSAGDYQLVITAQTPVEEPAKPEALGVNIEVKPGSDEVAPLNLRSKGRLPVAILGSSSFDAHKVDRTSVTFGHTGDEDSLAKCGNNLQDVNGDGRMDLVCHFDVQAAGFEITDKEGILKGQLRSDLSGDEAGMSFEGAGRLKVVQPKSGK